MKPEEKIFYGFMKSRGMNRTPQRDVILKEFIKIERHITMDGLYRIISKRHPEIGYTTVYRTMKTMVESGVAREVSLGSDRAYFEHGFGRKHHDHMVCIKCGKTVEFFDGNIERLQESITKKNRFLPLRHSMQIFGICKECRKKAKG